MLRLTGLFSFLALAIFAFSEPLKESISLRVKVVGRLVEEKPRLLPPKRLNLEEEFSYLDLSDRLLEPPRYVEEAPMEPLGEGKGCGEPKDRVYFRSGLNYYLNGDIDRAESRMLDILSLQNSAFIPQAQYVLGLIYSSSGREEQAVELFERSCQVPHPFREPSCEAFYALSFKLSGSPPDVPSPDLWRKVYLIKSGEGVKSVDCTDTVFKRYCSYVEDFVDGRLNDEYRDSTEVRKAVVLLKEGSLKEAEEILLRHSKPLSTYRDVALYYLGVIALKEGKKKQAYRYASLLEISDPSLSKNLYILLSREGVIFSEIAYELTGSEEVLRNSGLLSYNSGEYDVAYTRFLRAGDYLLAAWSALLQGDYLRAYEALKSVSEKNRDYYLWLLETLYWLGKDREMERVLSEVKDRFPDLYREYIGWLMFRKERWIEAYKHFEDPYHKALALYNAGKYRKVIEVLKESKTLKERLLKAKAAISMGNGKLAREFLKGETDEEIYLTGVSLFIEGKYREAIPYFENLLKRGSLKSKALLKMADSYYNLGDYERAKELYREILTLYPDSQEAFDATLALAQIELQNPSPELKLLIKDFMKRFPDSPLIPDLKYQLANVYLKEGEEEKARKILKELLNVEPLRGKALIKLATLEQDPKKKEELLKEAMKAGGRAEKDKATGMLLNLYLQTKEFEKLADFLSKGDFDDRKKALEIYMNENIQKAINLFDELVAQNPDDEDLKKMAMKMYDKTKGKKYLLLAKESEDKRVRAKALYLLGRRELKKDKRKALEYFVEVILSAEGVQPYYNKSILNAVDILLSLKARKDASCLLERLDWRYLTKKEIKKVKILKKKLPKCEVKK